MGGSQGEGSQVSRLETRANRKWVVWIIEQGREKEETHPPSFHAFEDRHTAVRPPARLGELACAHGATEVAPGRGSFGNR